MGFMIEISESKFEKLSENVEKMLKYAGKVMSCVEEMGEEYGMGHRGGGNMGYRDEDYEDDSRSDRNDRWGDMGERRGVRGTGRYSRMRF